MPLANYISTLEWVAPTKHYALETPWYGHKNIIVSIATETGMDLDFSYVWACDERGNPFDFEDLPGSQLGEHLDHDDILKAMGYTPIYL